MSDKETLRARVAALEAEVAALKQALRDLDQALHHLTFGTTEAEWVAFKTINSQE